MLEIKYYANNPNNETIYIPLFSLSIPAYGKVELKRWEEEIMVRNFKIDMIRIEDGEVVSKVDYKERLQEAKQNRQEIQAPVKKRSKKLL